MDWIDDVVRDVAELGYNSPIDNPNLMLVKPEELRTILQSRFTELVEAERDEARREGCPEAAHWFSGLLRRVSTEQA